MQLLRNHDGHESPQTVCELQVSLFAVSTRIALSYALSRGPRIALYCVSFVTYTFKRQR